MNKILEEKIEAIESKYDGFFDPILEDPDFGGHKVVIFDNLNFINKCLYSKNDDTIEGQMEMFDMAEYEDGNQEDYEWSCFTIRQTVLGLVEYGPKRIALIEKLYQVVIEEILKAKESGKENYAAAVWVMNAIVANILADLGENYGFAVVTDGSMYYMSRFDEQQNITIHGVVFDAVFKAINDMRLVASNEYIKTIDKFIRAATTLDADSGDYELFCNSYEGDDDERRDYIENVIRSFGKLLINTTTEDIEREKDKKIQLSQKESLDLLHKEHEQQNAKLEIIEKKIDLISSKIDGIKSVTDDLLSKAESFEEKEKIYSSYADSCVNVVLDEYNESDSKESDLYVTEEMYLKNLFGDIWNNKLDRLSRVCLHTSKVMFKQTLLIDQAKELEYSGICLLMTKSLEIEMKKRFYDGFINYLKNNNYPLEEYPSYLVLKDRWGNYRIKKETNFTLGNIPFIFTYKEDERNPQQNVKDREILCKYVGDELIPLKDSEEIISILKEFGMRIDKVVNDYRNKSAHRGSINYDKVTECFKLIIDEIQLMKKLLETFEK